MKDAVTDLRYLVRFSSKTHYKKDRMFLTACYLAAGCYALRVLSIFQPHHKFSRSFWRPRSMTSNNSTYQKSINRAWWNIALYAELIGGQFVVVELTEIHEANFID